MALDQAEWEAELERWLEPFLAHLSHRARRSMCPLYVAGLIGPGASRRISSSKGNPVSTTSRADPGRGYAGMPS